MNRQNRSQSRLQKNQETRKLGDFLDNSRRPAFKIRSVLKLTSKAEIKVPQSLPQFPTPAEMFNSTVFPPQCFPLYNQNFHKLLCKFLIYARNNFFITCIQGRHGFQYTLIRNKRSKNFGQNIGPCLAQILCQNLWVLQLQTQKNLSGIGTFHLDK